MEAADGQFPPSGNRTAMAGLAPGPPLDARVATRSRAALSSLFGGPGSLPTSDPNNVQTCAWGCVDGARPRLHVERGGVPAAAPLLLFLDGAEAVIVLGCASWVVAGQCGSTMTASGRARGAPRPLRKNGKKVVEERRRQWRCSQPHRKGEAWARIRLNPPAPPRGASAGRPRQWRGAPSRQAPPRTEMWAGQIACKQRTQTACLGTEC